MYHAERHTVDVSSPATSNLISFLRTLYNYFAHSPGNVNRLDPLFNIPEYYETQTELRSSLILITRQPYT